MCSCAAWTADSVSGVTTVQLQPASTQVQRFATCSPRLDADDEVDRRIEGLLDQGLVGRDAHLAAAAAIVAHLHVLVLVEIEIAHGLLISDEADAVASVGIEN